MLYLLLKTHIWLVYNSQVYFIIRIFFIILDVSKISKNVCQGQTDSIGVYSIEVYIDSIV